MKGPALTLTPDALTRRIGIAFMIASFFFALGSAPGFSSVAPPSVVGPIFFIGSLFFTSAGYLSFVQAVNLPLEGDDARSLRLVAWRPRSPDFWAAAIQLAGTLWFNLNTFNAMRVGLTIKQEDLRIWTPDFVGSICFLVASWIAWQIVGGVRGKGHGPNTAWWISAINMAGSVFFMLSAIAAFVVPDTGSFVDATLANSGTFLGAICFFWAAALLLPRQHKGQHAAKIIPTG